MIEVHFSRPPSHKDAILTPHQEPAFLVEPGGYAFVA
jgi:hypothetical protein